MPAPDRDHDPDQEPDELIALEAPDADPETGTPEPKPGVPSDQAPTRRQATALQYSPGDTAPQVIATGKGYLAEKIIAAAHEAGVPVRENPALANALAALDLGAEVPQALYRAVAETLAWAYSLDIEAAKRLR